MIIIEKLRKSIKPKKHAVPTTSVSVIDYYYTDQVDPRRPYLWHSQPQILRDQALKYLESHNILLAKHRGAKGVSPGEIDQFEAEIQSQYNGDAQIVYDIDIDDLLQLPKKFVRNLSQSRHFLLSNLVEGCIIRHNGFVVTGNILEKLGINGRNCFYHAVNLSEKTSDKLYPSGIWVLPHANAFATSTITNQSTQHLLKNPSQHFEKIDQMYDQITPYHYMSLNAKPRIPRVQFLNRLWQRGLLEKTYWSLGYADGNYEKENNEEYFSTSHKISCHEVRNDPELMKFIDAFSPWSLPKVIDNSKLDTTMLTASPNHLMNQADWHIVIETNVCAQGDPNFIDHHPIMITEKFYKAIIMGHPVIPIGWQGCHRDIERVGYKLPDVDFDHLDQIRWEDRLEGSLDLLERLTPGDRQNFRQTALTNFERLIDQDQLVRDVCEPLLHIREHPSFKAY